MVSNRRGIVLGVLYLFCLLTGVSPAAPASSDGSAGKLLSTPDGPGAWLLSPDGRLSRLELDAGRSVRHEIPGGPPGLTDIALSPMGRRCTASRLRPRERRRRCSPWTPPTASPWADGT